MPVPGVDYTVNPQRNIQLIADDEAINSKALVSKLLTPFTFLSY